MRKLHCCFWATLLLGWLTSPVQAHFLFIRVGPHAEAGRAVEVFFSEYATAGDPRFIERIAHTRLWRQATPGEFQELEVRRGADRLRSFLPSGDAVGVVGECQWGVLVREVPFLLRYYPKALSGDAARLNELKPRAGAPVEITAHFADDGVTLALLQDGQPVPGAQLTTVDDDLVNEELRADSAGQVKWRPAAPGHYCVYSRVTLPQPGELDGDKYTEIRMFPTLAFHWPPASSEADPEAVELFERAIAGRAIWDGFPGFTAKLSGSVDGRGFSGSVKVAADGSIELEISDAAVESWVDDQLGSLVMHRLPPSDEGSKPILQFADNDVQHPLGRLLTFVGGHFASSYRVQDDRITVVNRNFGQENMTITVLDDERNAEGRQLPRSYTVQYWAADTGSLLRSQSFQNRWQRVGSFDLPSALTVTEAGPAGLSVRHLELTSHELAREASTAGQ